MNQPKKPTVHIQKLGFALPIAILIAVALIAMGVIGYCSYKTSRELKELAKGLEVVKPEQLGHETADCKH